MFAHRHMQGLQQNALNDIKRNQVRQTVLKARRALVRASMVAKVVIFSYYTTDRSQNEMSNLMKFRVFASTSSF